MAKAISGSNAPAQSRSGKRTDTGPSQGVSRQSGTAQAEPLTHRLSLWGLLLLLFFPAFFSGMFFPPAQEKGLVFAVVLFFLAWVWKYFERNSEFLSRPMDYFALAMPVLSVVCALDAASYGSAVDDVVKYFLYFMVFWLVSRLITSEGEIQKIFHTVYLSAVGVALAGLGCATGLVSISDGFTGGRIYSTFQYPNATASYLAAAFILGLLLWQRAKEYRMPKEIPALKKFNRYAPYQLLYALGSFIIMAGFIGTKSIGATLVLAVVLAVYFGFMPGNRAALALHLLFSVISALPAVLLFLHAVAAKQMGLAWLYLLAGAILALALQLVYVLAVPQGKLQLTSSQKKAIWGVIVLVAVVLVAAGLYVILRHKSDIAKLYVAFRGRDLVERTYFFRDAFTMFLQRPILGWGGGGWQDAYRMFQSYLYNSNEVHCYYLQVMVEMGLLGIIAVAGLLISFFALAHKVYHGELGPERKFLVWTVTMVALELVAHAAIDFDFALSALFLVFWVMCGIIWALDKMERGEKVKKAKKKVYVPLNHSALVASTLACAIIFFGASSLAASSSYAASASSNTSTQDAGSVVTGLQTAIAYNPLNGDLYESLAVMDQEQGNVQGGLAEVQKAVVLGKYNPQYYGTMADLYTAANQPEKAVQAAQKALALAPFQQEWYEELSRVYAISGIKEISGAKKYTAQARNYFEETLQVPDLISARMNSLNSVEKGLWDVDPYLQTTSIMQLTEGVSNYFLSHNTQAETELVAAQKDSSLKDQAMLWQALLEQKEGHAKKAGALLSQVQKDQPSLAESFIMLEKLSL